MHVCNGIADDKDFVGFRAKKSVIQNSILAIHNFDLSTAIKSGYVESITVSNARYTFR